MRRWPAAWLLFLITTASAAATPGCQFDKLPAGGERLGAWINKSNWLAVENHRLTLQSAETFMPAWRRSPTNERPAATGNLRPVEDYPVVDPLDGQSRNLGFLLDSRLAVDGLVVLHNGRLVAERYRNGLAADKPRLLLEATRPLLNLLGAISISQGKLAADKPVTRYLPGLASSGGLRKISLQRLLEGDESLAWPPEELTAWRQAGGWTGNQAGSDMRAWLAQGGRWEKPSRTEIGAMAAAIPEDDLLAWVLADSNGMPLSRLFCEQLLVRAKPEHAVLWLSDAQGVELASGLGLSLRDFARLGQQLVDARSNRNRSKIPNWFIEALVAPPVLRTVEISGFGKGSERRYGFVRLGGPSPRVALLGGHGTSLYVDVDKRLVVATFASYPGANSPAELALLEQVWKAIERATFATRQGAKPSQ